MATISTPVNLERALATPDLRWPFPDELQWLAEQATTRSLIVEVGCYLGRSTNALAQNVAEGGHVYSIDDFYGPRDSDTRDEDRPGLYDAFLSNVAGLPVTPIRCDHADVSAFPAEWLRGPSDQRPDMVFIDGAHDYDSVKRDILIWRSRLRPGGLLCGHDRNESGVRRAIDELCPGWKSAPGQSMIWYLDGTESSTVAASSSGSSGGLRLMDVGEVKLAGTGNDYPVLGPRSLPSALPADAWDSLISPGQIPSQFGVAVLLPNVSRNEDGTLRWRPSEMSIALSLLTPLTNSNKLTLSIKDMERGPCRDALLEQAMSYNVHYGLFIDDDTVPPPDALQKLQYVLENSDDDVLVAAGIYTTKSDPAVPLVFQDKGIGPFWKWRRGEVFECQAIATGCMMIDLWKLRKSGIPKPWFVDVHGTEHAQRLGLFESGQLLPLAAEWTDDMYFCHKIRKAGWRLIAHGGVLPDHWGQDGKCYKLAADSYPMKSSAAKE